MDSQPESSERSSPFARPAYFTWTAVGLCVVVTVIHWSARGGLGDRMDAFLSATPSQIWDGRYYGLLSNVFLHGNLLHLAFNTVGLLVLGAVLERTVHAALWLTFFVASAAVAYCAELAASGNVAIGASGVVYAIFGLLWAGRYYQPAWREVATPGIFWTFVGWGVICLVASAFGYLHIANAAHAGGFLFGLAVGWTIYAGKRRPAAFAVVAILGIIVVLSLTWMPWSLAWILWRASKAEKSADYGVAITYFRRSLPMGANPEPVWQKISDLEVLRGNMNAAREARIEALEAAAVAKETSSRGWNLFRQSPSAESETRSIP